MQLLLLSSLSIIYSCLCPMVAAALLGYLTSTGHILTMPMNQCMPDILVKKYLASSGGIDMSKLPKQQFLMVCACSFFQRPLLTFLWPNHTCIHVFVYFSWVPKTFCVPFVLHFIVVQGTVWSFKKSIQEQHTYNKPMYLPKILVVSANLLFDTTLSLCR